METSRGFQFTLDMQAESSKVAGSDPAPLTDGPARARSGTWCPWRRIGVSAPAPLGLLV